MVMHVGCLPCENGAWLFFVAGCAANRHVHISALHPTATGQQLMHWHANTRTAWFMVSEGTASDLAHVCWQGPEMRQYMSSIPYDTEPQPILHAYVDLNLKILREHSITHQGSTQLPLVRHVCPTCPLLIIDSLPCDRPHHHTEVRIPACCGIFF